MKIKKKQYKKSNAAQSDLLLNALGRKMLGLGGKHKHLIKFNKEQQENLRDLNVDEIDNKTICKICFEHESDTILIPCGQNVEKRTSYIILNK